MRRIHALLLAGASIATLAAPGRAAMAQSAAPLCRGAPTDDAVRLLPQSLLADARAALAISVPDSAMRDGTFYRCMAGRVMVCFVGANLPCDEQRSHEARHAGAVGAWCASHSGAVMVPRVVTGGGMLEDWHCSGTRAELSPGGARVDARGFVAGIWKPLR